MSLVLALLSLIPLLTQPEPGAPAVPGRYIHAELASIGTVYDPSVPSLTAPRIFTTRLLKLSCSLQRFRFGFAAADPGAVMGAHEPTGAGGFLPLRVGYDIYRSPRRTLLCWSMVPDIYLEATYFPLLVVPRPPAIRVTVNCEVEYYGMGIGLETGYLTLYDQKLERHIQVFGTGLRVRAITANFGF